LTEPRFAFGGYKNGRKTRLRILETAITLTAKLGFGWTKHEWKKHYDESSYNAARYYYGSIEALKAAVFRECLDRISKLDGHSPEDVMKSDIVDTSMVEEEKAVMLAASFVPADKLAEWRDYV
jgi:hypothetical protein